MKFIFLMFIINLFVGQLLYGNIYLPPEELKKISSHELLDISERLRAHIIFMTFFNSKIDVYDNHDDIFSSPREQYFLLVNKYCREVLNLDYSDIDLKTIEIYCTLAQTLNFIDYFIDKLLNGQFSSKEINELFFDYYVIILLSSRQFNFSFEQKENENKFKSISHMLLSENVYYLSYLDFYNKIKLCNAVLSKMVKSHLEFFVDLNFPRKKLYYLDIVFSKKTLFPYLDLISFKRDFSRLAKLKIKKSTYEEVLNGILCDI